MVNFSCNCCFVSLHGVFWLLTHLIVASQLLIFFCSLSMYWESEKILEKASLKELETVRRGRDRQERGKRVSYTEGSWGHGWQEERRAHRRLVDQAAWIWWGCGFLLTTLLKSPISFHPVTSVAQPSLFPWSFLFLYHGSECYSVSSFQVSVFLPHLTSPCVSCRTLPSLC